MSWVHYGRRILFGLVKGPNARKRLAAYAASRFLFQSSNDRQLPASPTVAETSALMTASETVLRESTSEALAAKVFTTTASVQAIPAAVESGAVKTITAVSIVAMEPRARADENTAPKPIRAVVAIGRAGIGIVSIVTVGTYGSRADDVCRATNANADYNPLRVRIGRRKEENYGQSQES